VANGFAKGRLLRSERWPFTRQKTAFWNAKGRLLENKNPGIALRNAGICRSIMLSKADSNHHKQNQNLLCYHYTIGQSRLQR
jgi:hypothetical protein